MSRVRGLLAGLILAMALVAGCHQAKPEGPGVLLLKVEPARFAPGAIVTVSVKPPQGAVLAQVSGTVAVMGAPTVPLRVEVRPLMVNSASPFRIVPPGSCPRWN